MNFFSFKKNQKRIYLDFAAATPIREEVRKVMEPYLKESFGNPSAIHREGVAARKAVENAREELARTLRVRASSVTFTGSGTESNNLALFGCVGTLHADGKSYEDMEILTTAIEHPSVRETLLTLKKKGAHITEVDVDNEGRIELESLSRSLTEKTVLVTLSYINSEIGVVQDIKRISRAVKKFNEAGGAEVKIHLDASQAPLWLSCQPDALGVDMMTLDAGKCYGPKGVGVLIHRSVSLESQLKGGSQEGGLRAGTESPALIVGAVRAIVLAEEGHETRSASVSKLRDRMIGSLLRAIPEAVLNGSSEHRVPNNINISIPGFDTEFAVVVLDANGVSASTKSACSGADGTGSYVVRAIADEKRANATIRFTLGEETTVSDIDTTVSILKKHIDEMRAFSEQSRGASNP